jgi:transposase
MPWRRTDVKEQRMQFVIRATSGKERHSVLCREFGISRPTGYLWRRRYEQSRTLTEVGERSRRPHHSPTRTGPRQQQRVMVLRKQTGWGAKKMRILLAEERFGERTGQWASSWAL